ncbi:MAG: hypothetical protein JWQ25_584 [Daejeonella sp.]|nr:hypothetical protein [Daejeonella sp.]
MITKTLSEVFNGVIWKLLPETNKKLIAIESRNAENRQTAFSVLSYDTGELLLKEYHLDESWYVALSHIHQNLIFITGYESERSPVSKGITAIDLEKKEIQWQRFNYSYYDSWEEGLRVFNPNISPRRFEWLNYETGELISVPKPTALNFDLLLPLETPLNTLPIEISARNIVGVVLSLAYQDLIISSFHEPFEENLRLRLIITSNGTILFEDILADHIQKQQLETFFIQQDHLFYIRNGNQIVSYNLV